MGFKEFLKDSKIIFKYKEEPGFMFQAVFSKVNKLNNTRNLETLYFKNKFDALGYADKYNKELESSKDLDR